MIVRFRALAEAVRNSLFFIPGLFVVLGVGLAAAMLALDRRLDLESVPSLLRFTVDSARELLATVAGAIITVAAIVFALTGLSVQLASSQFSPRVVRGFLRGRSQQVAIGFMVGTFSYTLVVLRAVRSVEDEPEVIPALSTALALGLAITAIIAIVAFVNHTAHRLQSSELIRGVAEETLDAIHNLLPEESVSGGRGAEIDNPPGSGFRVLARSTGWVAQLSTQELLDVLPPGGMARVEVEVGDFVHPGRRLCTIWADGVEPDRCERRVRAAFAVGPSRTMQQDIGFGIRQIVDIALRALSPGVNDPTTAHECIVHLGAVLYEILRRHPPPDVVAGQEGTYVVLGRRLSYDDYVGQAFDEIRQSAASLPSLAAALVDTLAGVAADLAEDGRVDRDRLDPLTRQAALVLATVEHTNPMPDDVAPVRRRTEAFLATVPSG